MRRLNVYDIVSVTSPHARLQEVEQAEKALQEDFQAAESERIKNCSIVNDVGTILLRRQNALEQYKKELYDELKNSQGGILTYGKIVHFKDINIEKAVRKELGVFNRPITKIDMKNIKELCLEGVYSLEGLQYASNIETIALTWTDIFTDKESDLESAIIFSIIRPTLKRFFVSHSVIKQYTALSVLDNLEDLHLEANYGEFFDFSTFGLLTKINKLTISEKCISQKIKTYIRNHPRLLEHIEVLT